MAANTFRRLGALTAVTSCLLMMCAPATEVDDQNDDELTASREDELLKKPQTPPPTTTNWNAEVSWQAKARLQPQSIAELRWILRHSKKARLGGALHSMNDSLVADQRTVWIDMKALNRVGQVQTEANGTHTVWVEGGATIQKIGIDLAAQGYTFENLPTSKNITIGGAIANGVHGSSRDKGAMLSEQVVGLEIADTEGRLHKILDERTLKLTRIGVGSLGATARVKLRVVPNFDLIHEKVAGACADLRTVVESHDHAIIWYDPVTDGCAYDVWDRVDTPEEQARAQSLRDAGMVKADYETRTPEQLATLKATIEYAATNPAVRDLVRADGLSARPATVGEARFQFEMWLDLPSRNMSYAIPYNQVEAAMKDVKDGLNAIGYVHHFPMGLRVERVTDNSVMAPQYGLTSDTRIVHFETVSIIPFAQGDEQFNAFEQAMLKHDGRPHWGKEFSAVPKLAPGVKAQFETVRDRFDPKDKLVNDWVRQYVLQKKK